MHPTQPVKIFGNFFYAVSYFDQPLTFMENFTEIRRGLNAKGVAKYSDFEPIEGYISETVQNKSLGGKLVLITNRKSYMSFRLV